MNLSRMDLADFGSLDKIAVEIFRLVPDMPIPVPIEELARKLDITEIRLLEAQGFEGALVTTPEKTTGVILVNRESSRQRQRYSIGHELGHFLSPWHKLNASGSGCTAADMRLTAVGKANSAAAFEVEANRFSAQVLMPRVRFLADMRRRKGCDLQHVLALADQYDTSKDATARRYVELHDEPCAVVISQNGKFLRCYRHEDFPYIDVRTGQPVPPGSVTAEQDLPAGEVTEFEEIDGTTWFPSERGRRERLLYEQVLPQQNGFRLTLLTVENEEDLD